MLPFFRRIRKQLADDNKFWQYTRYAIGEILLVVIGILIALQINNWNEQRKKREDELTILKELYSTLIGDLQHQEDMIRINHASMDAADYLLGYFEQDLPYMDTLALCFTAAHSRAHGLARAHAYENAKRHGLDFMKTDSLKILLTWTYEVNTSWLEELNTRNNQYENETVFPLLTSLFNGIFSSDISDELNQLMVPLDYKTISNLKAYRNILMTTIFKRREFLYFQERRFRRMLRLKELLEQELELKSADKFYVDS